MPEAGTSRSGAPEPSARAERLIRSGMGVAVLGILVSLVALLPLVSDIELPSVFWALSMLTGVGFAMILLGMAQKGRRRARAQMSARILPD